MPLCTFDVVTERETRRDVIGRSSMLARLVLDG
jgi:hypothetical protein